MYFVNMYENRTTKRIEIVPSWRGMREKMEGVNLIKMYYKNICKCHNEPPLQLIYMLIGTKIEIHVNKKYTLCVMNLFGL
jgi:hypothetical protein